MAITLVPVTPLSALVSAPIALDGSFTDWTPVFDDSANCQYDATGDAGNTNADITLAAATGDNTYLFHYFRRAAATGGAAPTFVVFIDLDGDQRMELGERVLQYRLTGGNNYSSAALYAYDPVDDTNGDAMGGAIPGTWPAEITFGTPPYAGVGEAGGAQFEGRITWAALNLAPGAPISLQFAATQGSTTDYTGIVALTDYGVTVEPDQSNGAAAGATVVYPHVITNTGNTLSRFDLTAASSRGWSAYVRRASDQQTITFADIPPDGQLNVEIVLAVPGTTPNGARDTLTVTARHTAAGITDTATDITTVGPLLVVPDRTGSILPGGTIVYSSTVTNNTATPYTPTLTALSSNGWTTDIYDAAGTTQLTGVDLAAGESVGITVRVSVPAGTALGTVDVTTVEARASSSIRGKGYDTTTVRPELEVAPDNALPAGAGTSVLYRHIVTNSSAQDRTIALGAATVPAGWSVAILAADASTPLSSVALPAFGGSAEVVVRVTVPAGTPSPTTATTVLTATFGGLSDSATDITTVSRLATYGISGFGTPQTTFDLGDRVYARGMGLPPGDTVTFRWNDPAGALMATTTARIDATGIGQSSYNVGPALSGVGTWTVTLLTGTTIIDSVPFYIGYKASITSLAATGGDLIGLPVSVTSTLTNSGGADLIGTTVDYRIWWDADGNNLPSAGDSYIAQDGTWTAMGTGTGYTLRRTGVTVTAPNGTYNDAWSISNNDFRQGGTYKLTQTWIEGTQIDERTTEFFAVPGTPALTLSVSKTVVDFGTIQPGVTYTDPGVGVTVTAQSDYALQRSFGGQSAQLGMSSSLASEVLGVPTAGAGYTDFISINVPWDTNPGTYAADVTYTIVAR